MTTATGTSHANVDVRTVADPVVDPYQPEKTIPTGTVGGLIGQVQGLAYSGNSSFIESCNATGDVNTPSETLDVRGTAAGGLIGKLQDGSMVTDCSASGEVWGYQVGGFVGMVTGDGSSRIEDGHATGAVHGEEDPLGIVPGDYFYDIQTGKEYYTFEGTAHSNAGGFVGIAHRLVAKNSTATGAVSDYGPYATAGGFLGGVDYFNFPYTDVEAFESIATGDVTAAGFHAKAGGFVGQLPEGLIADCYAKGDVSVGGGGYSLGEGMDYVTSQADPCVAGGFIANLVNGCVYNSYATGTVTLLGNPANDEYGYGGGFLGYGGAVGGLLEFGGGAGYIVNCFSTGSGGGYGTWEPFAGFIKTPDPIILLNDYYLAGHGTDSHTGTSPATAAELADSNFALYTTEYPDLYIPAWDFDSADPIWAMGLDGLPSLRHTII